MTIASAGIRDAFNAIDPAFLIRNGFPADEYDPEVDRIFAELSRGRPVTEALIYNTLLFFFNRADEEHVVEIVRLIAAATP